LELALNWRLGPLSFFNQKNLRIMAENRNQGSKQNGQEENSSGQSRTSRRGFASMDPQRQREIASAGGRAAHRQGVAHEWSSEEARQAGRKGGQNSHGGGRNRSGERGPEGESERGR
jgi:uncharacterized protein